jgi:succinate-semialdehyde dehydrogenase/glutarate-semialdehyde dehydrogenase
MAAYYSLGTFGWSRTQPSVCANLILVYHGVYDTLINRLAETAGAMKVADGFEPGAVIGPLIDMKDVEKVESHIADAVKKGAKVVLRGNRAAQGGSFFEPTVLIDVTTDMIVTKEETFGPVAPLYRFKDEGEAVKMANDTEFGLAAYFYSRLCAKSRSTPLSVGAGRWWSAHPKKSRKN